MEFELLEYETFSFFSFLFQFFGGVALTMAVMANPGGFRSRDHGVICT